MTTMTLPSRNTTRPAPPARTAVTPMPREEEMYRALVARDAAYEGVFFAAVRTTGIFCKPTCTTRKPRRENVEYFASAADVLRAGYRPCKVCRPLEDASQTPRWAACLMSRLEAAPSQRLTDADLRGMGIDPARARRHFLQHFGQTFHGYARSLRLGGALQVLRSAGRTNGASHAHGYESESGFRDAFSRLFGTTPGKAAGVDALQAMWIETPLGAMLAAASETGLCMLEFIDRRMLETQIARVRRRFRCAVVPGRSPHLERAQLELGEYFKEKRARFDVPLDLRGSEFQRAVWERLLRIPYSHTSTYAAIAREIGRTGASRAIGRANGDNPIAIIVPCHRVVRSDGSLCGYGGGLWRKRRLLELEQTIQRPV